VLCDFADNTDYVGIADVSEKSWQKEVGVTQKSFTVKGQTFVKWI